MFCANRLRWFIGANEVRRIESLTAQPVKWNWIIPLKGGVNHG